MDRTLRALLLVIAVAVLGAGIAQPREERSVEGRVLEVKVRICQLKPRGCAGSMVLETDGRASRERLAVRVQLGVPIRRGDDYVTLGVLRDSVVKVVYVIEKGAIVAQWIEVLDRTERQ